MRIVAFIQNGLAIADIMKSHGLPDLRDPPPIPKFIDTSQAIDDFPIYDSFDPPMDESMDEF